MTYNNLKNKPHNPTSIKMNHRIISVFLTVCTLITLSLPVVADTNRNTNLIDIDSSNTVTSISSNSDVIENGVYYIINRQHLNYLQTSGSSTSALMKLYTFDGGNDQRWLITQRSGGYYSIISVMSGLALTVPYNQVGAEDVTLHQQPYCEANNQLWSITETSKGSYKIKPKSAEPFSTDLTMVAGNLINGTSEGINAQQRVYYNNSSYKDEWYISTRVTYLANVNSYYDAAYSIRYNETSNTSLNKINSYMKAVADVYMNWFGLHIDYSTISSCTSVPDACKMPVTSSNIDSLCTHSGSEHTYRNSLISDFNSKHNGNKKTTNALWSGHRILTNGAYDDNGNPEENRSCSSGTGVFMLAIDKTMRINTSQSVIFHELNHQYGADDHYHNPTIEGNNLTCTNRATCSVCGINPRPTSCIMYSRKIITNKDVICDECAHEILLHLDNHH